MNRFSGLSSGRASWTVAYERPKLMHCPVNAWLIAAGSRAGDPAQHRVGGLGAERDRGLAAHPQRLVRRRSGVAGRHDAGIVHAGQCLIGEQPAERIGAKSAAGGQIRHAEARRPHRHRAGQRGPVVQYHRVGADLARPLRSRARRLQGGAATWPPNGGRAGSVTDPAIRRRPGVTGRPCSASSDAVSMPVNPAPTTVTGALGCSSSNTARSRSAYSNSAIG